MPVTKLKLKVDTAVVKPLVPHLAKAVEDGVLSETEAMDVLADEMIERGLKVDDNPFRLT
jgi:hypothetical protein